MSPLLTVLAASVTTFAATNLDDIFRLTVFFARRVPTGRIVAGQYLGFAAIILLSFAGLWAVGLTIPNAWIRLLGIPPLGIGIRHLLQIRNQRSTQATEADGTLGVLSIAAITQANGADNVGVYGPFFLASRSHVWSVLTVYGLLVLVWCVIGKHLGIDRFRERHGGDIPAGILAHPQSIRSRILPRRPLRLLITRRRRGFRIHLQFERRSS